MAGKNVQSLENFSSLFINSCKHNFTVICSNTVICEPLSYLIMLNVL